MAETAIACVRMDCEPGGVSANRLRIVERLREAAGRGADLIVFPECAATGYCFDSLDEAAPFAETLEGETARAVSEPAGGWRFIGRSKILSCDGDTRAEAGDGEEIIYAALDLSSADDNHIVNVPGAYEIDGLKARRPDLYAPIGVAEGKTDQRHGAGGRPACR